MTEPKHTPTPWQAWHVHRAHTGFRCAVNAINEHSTEQVGVCYGADVTIVRANAEFIVRACNAHDKLVEALESLVAGIDRTECTCSDAYKARGLVDPSCPRCHLDVSDEDMDKARAAIEAAKEST